MKELRRTKILEILKSGGKWRASEISDFLNENRESMEIPEYIPISTQMVSKDLRYLRDKGHVDAEPDPENWIFVNLYFIKK